MRRKGKGVNSRNESDWKETGGVYAKLLRTDETEKGTKANRRRKVKRGRKNKGENKKLSREGKGRKKGEAKRLGSPSSTENT